MIHHNININTFSAGIEDFQKIAENQNLKKNDLRVFIFLACRLESKFPRKIDKKQMSRSLGLDRDEINKSLQKLTEEGIITGGADRHIRNGLKFCYNDPSEFYEDQAF